MVDGMVSKATLALEGPLQIDAHFVERTVVRTRFARALIDIFDATRYKLINKHTSCFS